MVLDSGATSNDGASSLTHAMTQHAIKAALAHRSQGTYLAVGLPERGGEFVVVSSTTLTEAMTSLPQEIINEGLWLVARQTANGWRIERHQFGCMSELAMLQLASSMAAQRSRELAACQSRHPAGKKLPAAS